ncbi:MAG: penicillin acylase family protein [Bacteroidetes bacterium]|nr:penicillin acylase family protein [Bacteroidota bacterium]
MKKWILISAGTLITLFLIIWFGARWYLSGSVADYSDEFKLSGLDSSVTVTFDEKGIPQIWGKSTRDVFRTAGYLHASERLFQMELIRRLVEGKLSEVFGDIAIDMDKQNRTIGFYRKGILDSENLDAESLNLISAYCEGINSWKNSRSPLPPEFVLLGFTPADWKPEDCLSILIYQTWFSHSLMDDDQPYFRMQKALGDSVLKYMTEFKSWSPATVSSGLLSSVFDGNSWPGRMSNASNSWVVSPEKSTSGSALHASDPHLQLNQIPGFWYLMGMRSADGLNAVGVTTPGIPFIAMGHNDSIAWAFTVASVDVIDYYRFTTNLDDSLQVKGIYGTENFSLIKDSVLVKGKDQPVYFTIRETPVGPVVDADSVSVLAIKWAGYDFDAAKMLKSGFLMNTATNFPSFRKAVNGLGALDVNWTYSDRKGNIGYQLGVPVPVRSFSNTFTELDGADSTLRWKGYLADDEKPFSFNPQKGWIATCNNQITDSSFKFPLPGFYDPYRIVRISELLQSKPTFSVTDMQTFQMDSVSIRARRWKSLLADGLERAGKTELAGNVRAWDGSMGFSSTEATLFNRWWRELPKALFEDELGENWPDGRKIVEAFLLNPMPSITDNIKTSDKKEDLTDISAIICTGILSDGKLKSWGETSHLTFSHPLSMVKILDVWLNLNRGPVPASGDWASLNANFNRWNKETKEFETEAGPSMRFVLDWTDVDGFTINGNLGQSGNPFSKHYDDFLENWQTGSRWNVPFARKKVEEKAVSVMVLKP